MRAGVWAGTEIKGFTGSVRCVFISKNLTCNTQMKAPVSLCE